MTPRTKEQNEDIRLRRLAQIRKAAADVFLNKGLLLEIRDVAAQAGLGYGTVYHYYSNKGDLLHDLLWDALERNGGWLQAPAAALQKVPLGTQLKVPLKVPLEVLRASPSGEYPADGHSSSADTGDTGYPDAADFRSRSRGADAHAQQGPAAAVVRLLQLWAEDHALYLLYKLAGEGFASLPEARSTPLSVAFQREVLEPFAALLQTGHTENHASAHEDNASELPYRLQRAEMLLAALVGCASLSLRRGRLYEEARDIARLLKL